MSFKRGIAIAVIMSLLLAGCGNRSGNNSQNNGDGNAPQTDFEPSPIEVSEMFTERDSDAAYDESSAKKVLLQNRSVTVSGGGTYVLSGSISDGQIVVDAAKDDKVQLVLCGVDITSQSSAAIYVKQADKVFITLAEKSENKLTNKTGFTPDGETNVDGVIFSKDDLTVNGSGSLVISSADHGIVSKDDLVITGGSLSLDTTSHALSGKDSIRISGGSFDITAGKDGFHAENSEENSLGYFYFGGGSVKARCEGDGIDASGQVQIDGGSFEIITGGGAENAPKQTGGFGGFKGNGSSVDSDSLSSKGIKSSGALTLTGGSFEIDSSDDALHSNSSLGISGGEYSLKTGDDGFHADEALCISDGRIAVLESYEGVEGLSVEISGGEVDITASDDGINAAGGNDESGFGGFGGQMRPDSFGADSNSFIKISGGTVTIDASGDGIDSNGALYVSGGETIVSGPTNNGNGALDYGSSAEITGGVFIAVGASGMSAGFTSASGQGAIMQNAQGQSGTGIRLADSDDKTLFEFTAKKSFGSVVLSHPDLKEGESYLLYVGEQSYRIEMTDSIYGGSGGFGGQGGPGGHGGFGGMKPGKYF